MRLALGSRRYDLTSRALVMATVRRATAAGEAVAEGADVVEVDEIDGEAEVPICVAAGDDAAVVAAVVAGAQLVRLSAPTPTAYTTCADAGVAVVVPDGATAAARAAGLDAERIVPEGLVVDVVGAPCPLAAMVVGVIRGARIVRTTNPRQARRVVDVLAAVLEAGTG